MVSPCLEWACPADEACDPSHRPGEATRVRYRLSANSGASLGLRQQSRIERAPKLIRLNAEPGTVARAPYKWKPPFLCSSVLGGRCFRVIHSDHPAVLTAVLHDHVYVAIGHLYDRSFSRSPVIDPDSPGPGNMPDTSPTVRVPSA